MKSSSGLV